MKPSKELPIAIAIMEAKPNRLFTEEQRAEVRFLHYSAAVPCAECRKKRKTHWTLLLSFKAKSMAPTSFFALDSGKVHLPLTPVCQSHMLTPAAPMGAAKLEDDHAI